MTRPAVLVCEDLAHETVGHYAVRFAELAQGFADAGCDTWALTSRGWAYAGDLPFPADRVGHYGWLSATLFALTGRHFDATPWKALVRNVALGLAVRGALRRLGLRRALVVVVSSDAEPAILRLLGGRHDWIIHRFWREPGRLPEVLLRWAQRAEERRAAAGARMVVAVPDAAWTREWARRRPGQAAVQLRLAGAARVAAAADPRGALGLPAGARIALAFGEAHEDKRLMIAVDAIRLAPDWTLAVVGNGASVLAAALPEADRPANLILRQGVVSNHERALWHQAADAAILSFAAGYRRNSGTLMDAVAWGRPVAASDESFAADLARRYSLGEVFAAEDAHALARALGRIAPLPPAVVAAALADLGSEQVARDHLSAIGAGR